MHEISRIVHKNMYTATDFVHASQMPTLARRRAKKSQKHS